MIYCSIWLVLNGHFSPFFSKHTYAFIYTMHTHPYKYTYKILLRETEHFFKYRRICSYTCTYVHPTCTSMSLGKELRRLNSKINSKIWYSNLSEQLPTKLP